VKLAVRPGGDYLRRWGFTPQRPVKRALERQDAQIQVWLAEHYPKIAARAKAEGAEVHWGDATGISNQAVGYPAAASPGGRNHDAPERVHQADAVAEFLVERAERRERSVLAPGRRQQTHEPGLNKRELCTIDMV
jgi:hypothetical protein